MASKSQSSKHQDRKPNLKKNAFPYIPEDIMSHVGVGIYIVQNGNFIYISPFYQEITGYSEAELVGHNSFEFVHPDDRKTIRKNAIDALKGKASKPYEYRFIKKNGTSMWILEMVTSIIHNGKQASLGSFMDITKRKVMEEKIRQSEERYRSIIEQMEEGYYESYFSGRFIFVNDAQCRSLGYSREELLGGDAVPYIDEKTKDQLSRIAQEVCRTNIPIKTYDVEITKKDGSKAIHEISLSPIRDSNGNPTGMRGISRDVTERKVMEEKLKESEERYRTILEEMEEWYFETDLVGNIIFFNDILTRNLGYSPEVLNGANFRSVIKEQDERTVYETFHQVFKTGKPIRNIPYEHVKPDGFRTYTEFSVFPKWDHTGKIIGFRGVGHDITERKRAEEKIQYLATHDSLTELPNRLMFNHLLEHAIETARRYKQQLAVLFFDLDRFKIVNDTFGHEAGDQLLQEISTRLRKKFRAADIIARLGGDEFVMLIEGIENVAQVSTVARTILSTTIKPVTIMSQECRLTASIGISMYPKDGEDVQTLMKNADIAMYFAKEEGRNNFQFYSKNIKIQSVERLSVEQNLRQALKHKEFYLQYQAKYDFLTGTITGVEALLRWNSPALGMVSPGQFIPVAEETGLIVPIGRWVLKTACFQNAAWQRQGLPPVCISVNLSLRQLSDERLIKDIKSALNDSGLAPNFLELEITESMVMHDPEHVLGILSMIKAMNVKLSIDDFGTGYSSLSQIKSFPVDALKIDRSFIRNIPHNSEDKAITKTIIAMGKTLNLAVIAEGVETKEQMDFLQKESCDGVQGFYFSKPVLPDQFAHLLRTHVPAS